ncbi:16S rRNA (guanine(966)-N(2))-methyltransferase, SSU rRNA m(2)G966 [Rubellimicrobium mesophilum DSM 19309]|uniref:16S rRNA (Guanine(966)-N(2))-methyltransferase, SSU rRNA m(2)G966 n=1 Tax=Rubellimicrobium mesophilum DSM 19309 TaxID=442562 RepID=A0A017HX86_9RHOB|nr:RsmD family RNA methyltransferase [Rubellimicrobium mesophilum]EYD78379.1 16S rRNA (guanine(966)-N(2))-methyltransferase, SSU rRNA m(2)G966 [Rubellimicrobium mesophilum DSM 19309]
MRIVGGANRGLTLAEVGEGDAAAHLRPTSDRVREAVFNLLEGGRFGDPVAGARVLDLFAGTGALSLEALSRGAMEAVLVEDGRVGQRLIRENVARAKREGQARVLATDATKLPANAGEAFKLCFLDPPYGRGLGTKALASALAGRWLAPGALVVWEEAGPMMPLPGTGLLDRRSYGGTAVTLLRVDQAQARS